MYLSGSRRRMSVALLAGVERQGSGSVGGGGSEVGVQSFLPLGAFTSCGAHPFSVLQPAPLPSGAKPGPTPRTWGGALTFWMLPLPAVGLRRKLVCQ